MIVKFAVYLGAGKDKLVAVCLFELCYFVYSRLVCGCVVGKSDIERSVFVFSSGIFTCLHSTHLYDTE